MQPDDRTNPPGPADPADANPLRDGLLAQQTPRSDHYTTYRKEIEVMLENNETGLRREKRYVGAMWIYLIILCTVFMIIGGLRPTTSLGVWFGVQAVFW